MLESRQRVGKRRKNEAEKVRVRNVRGEYEALKEMFSDWTSCPISSKVDVLKVTYSIFCEVLGLQVSSFIIAGLVNSDKFVP